MSRRGPYDLLPIQKNIINSRNLMFSGLILDFQVFDGETIDVSTPRGVFCGEVYPPAIISQVSVGLLITYHSQLAAVDEGFDIKFYRHEQGQCKI